MSNEKNQRKQESPRKVAPKDQKQEVSSTSWKLSGGVVLLVAAAAATLWLRQDDTQEAFSQGRETADRVEPLETAEEATSEPPGDGVVERPIAPEAPRAAPVGSLVVSANVRGAAVYLNGRRVGKTPHRATPLKPGRYELRVEEEGYQPFEREIEVSLEEEVLSVTLEKTKTGEKARPAVATLRKRGLALNESVAVKHKHRLRLGSCQGVLRASEEGIRYETNHKHAFAVSLSGMERWNFNKKSLSLKIRDGKKYNFAERNGDEGALSAFHRRVEEAFVKSSS